MLQVEDLSPGLFQKVLYGLWSICGKRGVLPESYMIQEGLSRTKEFASGGYANVWEGRLVGGNSGSRRVCIKAIKIAVNDGEGGRSNIEKVSGSPSVLPGSFTQSAVARYFMRRPPCGCD